MARFTIYSSDGQTARYTGTPVYHGTHLRVAYLEFREIASPTPIDWAVGDYVDYTLTVSGNQTRTGFRYKLYSIPQPTKQARPGTVGDAFVYSDVQFHCATKDLEIAPFRDLVISDNTIHFTTMPDISTYENVYGIRDRIQENLNTFYGSGVWSVRVVSTSDADLLALLNTTKEFTISNGSCLDALNLIYSQWGGIGWVYSVENGVNIVTIGRPNIQDADNTTSVFSYGMGNGIKVLRKGQSDKNEFATRLYAYGSTRNLIPRYYNNLSPAIYNAESVYIPNLMLPPSTWGTTGGYRDARKAFLSAPTETVNKYGLIPKTVYFDGSGDYEEIYPSIEGVTTGDVRAAMTSSEQYYPDTTIYPAGTERIDEVVARVNPTDNGVVGTATGGKYAESVVLTGIGQVYKTEHVWKTATEFYISLGALTQSATVTNGGTVTFTPNVHGTIYFADVELGGLTLNAWVEIDGEMYKSFSIPLNKTQHSAAVAPVEVSFVAEKGGTAILYADIEARPLNPSDDFDVVVSLSAGNTTLNVESILTDTFTVYTRQIGFDISKQQSAISGGLCTINFKTGWCAGRGFTVRGVEYVSAQDRWALTVARQSDESIGQYFPNSIYRIEVGDRFVLTDLTMPELYIETAQARLQARASEVLAGLSTPKMVYEPEIDAKVLAQSPEVILEGMYMPLTDADVVEGGTEWILIDSIEIDESEEAIPTYKITLQDEKRESFFSRITRATGRNARSIRDMELDETRVSVGTSSPDYDVATKSSSYSSQFFTAIRDDELNAIVGAKALYDLYITQTEADEEEQQEEVIKNISAILRHLSLQVVNEGTENEYTVLLSDITFASQRNIVAGGIGSDGGSGAGGSLAGLSDVTMSAYESGQVLVYNSNTSHWVNTLPTLSMLSGVSVTGTNAPTNGQALAWDGTVWKPMTISGGGSGSVTVVNNNATIGPTQVTLGTINGTAITAKMATTIPASITIGTSNQNKNLTVYGQLVVHGASNYYGNLLPSGSLTIGTEQVQWAGVYGTTIYEGGTALASKYQAKLPDGGTDGYVLTWDATASSGNGAWVAEEPSGGSSVTVDDAMSSTSTNPVQNKVIYTALSGKQATIDSSNKLAASLVSGLADVATSGSYGDLTGTPDLADVATSGAYDDLSGKPDIPTVNNATLTIKMNGATKGTFTANASSDKVINLGTVLTEHQSLDGYATTEDLADKADLVADAVSGNFAGLDSDGNITDSGYNYENFLTQHQSLGLVASTVDGVANAATTDGNTYINLLGGGAKKAGVNIVGASNVTVTSDAMGKITVTGPNLTTYMTKGEADALFAHSLVVSSSTPYKLLLRDNMTEPNTLSEITGSNIVSVIGAVAVARAIADADGNTITSSYLRKNIDDTMSANLAVTGDLTVGTSNTAKALTVYGTQSISGTLTVGGDATLSGSVAIGAQTDTTTAKTLSVYGRNNSSTPALKIYGVASSSTRYLTSIYRDASYLQISSAVYVTGNIVASGNIVAGSASDRRLKKDIRDISLREAADLLTVLHPVTYEWNEKAGELGGLQGVSRGFLADEYLDMLPNAGRKIWGEYDAIDYNQVIPYLVAGWQQQNLRIRELEDKVDSLQLAIKTILRRGLV